MVTYQKSGVNIEIRYEVQYIGNEKDYEYICSGRHDKGEPWERYKVKSFDNLDEAMSTYLIYFFRMTRDEPIRIYPIYDVKLFEQVLVDGEVIRESYIEPSQSILYDLRTTFDYDTTQELYKLRGENDRLEETLALHNKFLEMHKAKEAFKDFEEKYIEECLAEEESFLY